jgi:hypothetical protein
MTKTKTSISAALSTTLASLKPAASVPASAPAQSIPAPEKIFPEPKIERSTVFLFGDDLAAIDKLVEAAKASGRRKVNQSQAIRALIRTGVFRPDVLDRVLAEDGRRKK